MDVCLLWVLYAIRYRSLRRADHSSRGVLTKVVCLYDEKTSYSRPRSMTAVETREKYTYTIYTLVNTYYRVDCLCLCLPPRLSCSSWKEQ
jgi:hypothetical protein